MVDETSNYKPADAEVNDPEKKDEALFSELTSHLGITDGKQTADRYWRIRRLIRDSRKNDVSFEVQRASLLRGNLDARSQTIVDSILKRGYVSEALNWLHSATPEGMRYGNGSKQLRLEKAQELAVKAGTTLEEIAAEHGLEIP